jgi:hypothetical protein
MALEEQPSSLMTFRALVDITPEPQQRAELLDRFEREVRRELAERPDDPEPARKLLGLGELRGEPGTRFVALSVLSVLEAETPAEREAYLQLTRAKQGTPGRLTPLAMQDLAALCQPGLAPGYGHVLGTVLACAADIDQLEPGRFGAGRGQRISTRDAHPLRDEISALASAFNLRISEFYVGGDDPTRVVALPKQDELAFLVGPAVSAPLSGAARRDVALQLAAMQLCTLPLLSRSPKQGARLMLAALAAAECPLPDTIMRNELGELPRTLAKALPRRVKKVLPELVRALPDGGASMEQQCRLALRHTRRAALLLASDLHGALEQVLGAVPARAEIGASEDATDLVCAWSSTAMARLRNKLGFAT